MVSITHSLLMFSRRTVDPRTARVCQLHCRAVGGGNLCKLFSTTGNHESEVREARKSRASPNRSLAAVDIDADRCSDAGAAPVTEPSERGSVSDRAARLLTRTAPPPLTAPPTPSTPNPLSAAALHDSATIPADAGRVTAEALWFAADSGREALLSARTTRSGSRTAPARRRRL